jgi:ABC-2 type transport system permease protein
VTPLAGVRDAVRYEFARLRSTRSTRTATVLALLGSALLTLPAARHAAEFAGPTGFGHGPASAAARVVSGGAVAHVLPVAAVVLAAAWVGAASVADEYRHGSAQLMFLILPRRSTVLVAKVLVSAVFGAVLCLLGHVVAFGTARLGFVIASSAVEVPARLALPGSALPPIIAALGGAVGVLAAASLRFRLLAVPVAVACCAAVTAVVTGAVDPASTYLSTAANSISQFATQIGLPRNAVSAQVIPAAAIIALALAAVLAIRRRRTW